MLSPFSPFLPLVLMVFMLSDGMLCLHLLPTCLSVSHRRVVESTLRTMNNLLERLHASFFFYVLTGPGTFLKIGQYLPSAVIVSVAMMLGGLRAWIDAGWVEQQHLPLEKGNSHDRSDVATKSTRIKWKTRRRNVLPPLAIILVTHVIGGMVFGIVTSPGFIARPGVCHSRTRFTLR